jgi:hypothetical protein
MSCVLAVGLRCGLTASSNCGLDGQLVPCLSAASAPINWGVVGTGPDWCQPCDMNPPGGDCKDNTHVTRTYGFSSEYKVNSGTAENDPRTAETVRPPIPEISGPRPSLWYFISRPVTASPDPDAPNFTTAQRDFSASQRQERYYYLPRTAALFLGLAI